MKLDIEGKKNIVVLKGFSKEFLKKHVQYLPLIENDFAIKVDIRNLDDDYKRQLMGKLMSFEGIRYVTYEEFILIQELGEDVIKLSGALITIVKNSMYPEYYRVCIEDENICLLLDEVMAYQKSYNEEGEIIENIEMFFRFYGDVKKIGTQYFVSYKNSERVLGCVNAVEYYDNSGDRNINTLEVISSDIENVFEMNSEVESYLRLIAFLLSSDEKDIGIVINDMVVFDRHYRQHMNALLNVYGDVNFFRTRHKVVDKGYRTDFSDYLKDIWGYESFKQIDVYQKPDENKDVVKVSQAQIIEDIVNEAEKANTGGNHKDVFITAPTGAGKSVIFQIAAIYLANKYRKMTIIVSPLIALMKDQVDNLHKKGVTNVAYINSELNFIEKENVINKIKDEKIDLLYLAPETLLSYTIENFVGERMLGLFIVDEAHIVTTWGKGFRPDYWYLGKYLSKIRTGDHQFPIVTFTATAVYGGNDDMYDETIESLNMKSTIKYLGDIKRNDIGFSISVNQERIGKEKYRALKLSGIRERIKTNIENGRKMIVYFPYASLAGELEVSTELHEFSNQICMYTGKLTKMQKQLAEEDFKAGRKLVMFATKAFGMGIDINDIVEVYHYAPTGNLNDYVQEIGRAARKQDIHGLATIDFMSKDFSFINMLFGMSSIKQYQIKAVLKKIYSIYSQKSKQNFLVTPNDFSYLFTNESRDGMSALERKIKTVLLMIEKDLEMQFGFPVLISRPKSMFSKAYVVVDKVCENNLKRSTYGKYFKKIHNGRNHERQDNVDVSDAGDVFLVDLKKLWEEHYPDRTFASFKYLLLTHDEELKFPYSSNLHLRYRININTKNELMISELKDTLVQEIEKVNAILDAYKDEGKMFSIQEFASELNKLYSDKEMAFSIASSYIDLITPTYNANRQTHRSVEFNQQYKKYRIVNRTYHNAKREIVYKSSLLKKLNIDASEYQMYYPKTHTKDFDLFRVIYLLEIFNLCSYEILGGESPEIFIRLNDPLKVGRISSDTNNYNNEILKMVRKRHENSNAILRKFFSELSTDQERWNFIEDYFLGYDLINGEGIN